jgi:type I restriction enzyme S subunit
MAWKIKRLGDVCDVVGGGTPKTGVPAFWGGDIVWVTPKDLGRLNSFEIFESEKMISDQGLKKSSAKILPRGSVVLSSRAPIGHLAITGVPLATNQGCRSFVCKEDEVYNKFLYYFLLGSKEYLNSLGEGSTFKEVSGSKLKEIEISLPSLHEQKRVVKVLDEVFEGIGKAKEIAEKNLRNSRELFDSYLQDVFENGSDKWKEKTIAELGPVQTGTTPKTSEKGNYGDFIPFIKPSDFLYDNSLSYHNQGLSEIGLKRGRLIKEFSVLMVCIGTVGKVSYSDRDVSCNQQINAVTLRSLDEAKFFCYQMRTKKFQSIVLRNAPKATLPIINKSKWQGLAVMVPPLSEQKTIVKKLDALAEETRKLEAIYRQKLANLEELKKSVLKAAFTPNSGFGKEENIDFAHSSQTVG